MSVAGLALASLPVFFCFERFPMTVLVSGFRVKKKPTTITSVVGWDSARALLNSEIVSERGRTHPTHTQSTGGAYKPRPANQGEVDVVHLTTTPPHEFLLKMLSSLPDVPRAVNAIRLKIDAPSSRRAPAPASRKSASRPGTGALPRAHRSRSRICRGCRSCSPRRWSEVCAVRWAR